MGFTHGFLDNVANSRASARLGRPRRSSPVERSVHCDRRGRRGSTLKGQHDYLRFPAEGLPLNHSFWSLTMNDALRLVVANPINQYSVHLGPILQIPAQRPG
jgi:hypothetical protein